MIVASGGPALLFTNVENADFPCVTNLFGSAKRVDLAFGHRPERFIKQIVDIAQELPSLAPQKVLWRNKRQINNAAPAQGEREKHGRFAGAL